MNAPPYDGLYIGQPKQAAAAYADWLKKNPAPVVTLAQVADHIEHVARVAGIDHVGIGSDFDGVDNVLPTGLGDVSNYPALIEETTSSQLTSRSGPVSWCRDLLFQIADECRVGLGIDIDG